MRTVYRVGNLQYTARAAGASMALRITRRTVRVCLVRLRCSCRNSPVAFAPVAPESVQEIAIQQHDVDPGRDIARFNGGVAK